MTPVPQLNIDEGKRTTLSVSVAGGDGNYSFNWVSKTPGLTIIDATVSTPEVIVPIVSVDETASLVVTVTDGLGSSASAPITLLVRNKPLLVSAGSDIQVVDDVDVTLHAQIAQKTTGPYTYAWTQTSTGANAQIANADTANPTLTLPVNISETYEFELEVIDANGEIARDAVLVTSTFDLSADAGVDQTVPENTTVFLHATDVGGLGATAVTWTQLEGKQVSLIDANTLNPSFTAPITSTNLPEKLVFELIATDTSGRIAKDTVSVEVDPVLPSVTVAGPDRFPESSTSSLTASATGGTPPYSYVWTNSGDFFVTVTSSEIQRDITFVTPAFSSQTDKVLFQVKVTDARGHTAVGSHGFLLYETPTIPDLTLVESIPSTIKSGTNSPATVGVTGGTAPYIFAWTDDSTGVFTPDNTVQNPSYTAPTVAKDTSVNVNVNVSDNDGASDKAVKSVLVKAVPLEVKVNSNTTVVRGQSVQLNATVSGGIQPYLYKTWLDLTNGLNARLGNGLHLELDTSNYTAGDYTIGYAVQSSPPATSGVSCHSQIYFDR